MLAACMGSFRSHCGDVQCGSNRVLAGGGDPSTRLVPWVEPPHEHVMPTPHSHWSPSSNVVRLKSHGLYGPPTFTAVFAVVSFALVGVVALLAAKRGFDFDYVILGGVFLGLGSLSGAWAVSNYRNPSAIVEIDAVGRRFHIAQHDAIERADGASAIVLSFAELNGIEIHHATTLRRAGAAADLIDVYSLVLLPKRLRVLRTRSRTEAQIIANALARACGVAKITEHSVRM